MNGPSMNGFGKTLAGSVALHVALIAAALFFVASGNRVFISPVYTVDLVAQGPRPAIQAPQAPPEIQPVKAAPLPEPAVPKTAAKAAPRAESSKASAETVKVKAAKPSVDEALKKIEKKVERRQGEAMVASSIDDLKKKMETERRSRSERVSRLKEEIGSRPAPAKPQEARAAQSPATGGSSKASLEKKYSAYYGVLKERVDSVWQFPEGLKDNNISVIVSVKIARTGKLLDVSVEKSSGDHAFDASLLKAVRKAAPFPPLPVDLEGNFLETGLRFCPGCAQ
jgi:TonB family protein